RVEIVEDRLCPRTDTARRWAELKNNPINSIVVCAARHSCAIEVPRSVKNQCAVGERSVGYAVKVVQHCLSTWTITAARSTELEDGPAVRDPAGAHNARY